MQKYDYKAFGNFVSITGPNGNDISQNQVLHTAMTFIGREFDEESGLLYLRARYYDPSIGRFLQTDPAPGSVMKPNTEVNKYIYAGSNAIGNANIERRTLNLYQTI